MITALIIISALLLLFLVLSLFSGYYMYRLACVRRGKPASAWEDDATFARGDKFYEEFSDEIKAKRRRLRQLASADNALRLTVKSYDGLTLAARLIPTPCEKSRGIIASFHGYRSEPSVDFGASSVDFLESGFSLLLVDQRAHGNSEGRHITFGVKERYDVISWCRLLEEMFPDSPVILDGLSMGASTVMMSCALELPSNVRAAIADCGYTTPKDICTKVLTTDMRLPRFPIFHAATLVTRLFAGYRFDEASAPESLKSSTLPTLIVHGTGDRFVPFEMGLENSRAGGDNVSFLSVENAGHGLSYLVDKDSYDIALDKLFRQAGIPEA